MLKKTERFLTTQKCEAVNKAIGVTAPKNITFSRNHISHVHTAIRGVNCGISEAIISKCQDAGSPITAGTRVSRQLFQMQCDPARSRAIKCKSESKQRRHNKRKALFQQHAQNKKNLNIYKKNVCTPSSNQE